MTIKQVIIAILGELFPYERFLDTTTWKEVCLSKSDEGRLKEALGIEFSLSIFQDDDPVIGSLSSLVETAIYVWMLVCTTSSSPMVLTSLNPYPVALGEDGLVRVP